MLDERSLLGWLMAEGLATPSDVASGALSIRDLSRRNRNVMVSRGERPGWLVKLARGPGAGLGTLTHEAAAYRALEARGVTGEDGFAPRLHRHDPVRGALVLDLAPGAETLRRWQVTRRRFPARLAARLGEALASLHDWPETVASPPASFAPSILTLHTPAASLVEEASAANLALVRRIQAHADYRERFAALTGAWREEAVVHGDFKWENCVVRTGPGGSRGTRLWIVDWEFAGRGDPAWDVGSVFCDYLASWLGSIPLLGRGAPSRWVDLAALPLELMRPAIAAFWTRYAARRRLDPPARAALLARAVRFAAARIVQSAYEAQHEAVALSGNVLCHLQLSANLLERPAEGALHLLGLPDALEAA